MKTKPFNKYWVPHAPKVYDISFIDLLITYKLRFKRHMTHYFVLETK